MTWRDTKRTARSTVHQTMKVRCIYLAQGIVPDSNSESGFEFTELEIRVHEHQTKLGDQAGTSLNSAERFEPDPRLIFWKAELEAKNITLKRNDVVSVSAGEAYRLGPTKPHDQETITVPVTRLAVAETANLPIPE